MFCTYVGDAQIYFVTRKRNIQTINDQLNCWENEQSYNRSMKVNAQKKPGVKKRVLYVKEGLLHVQEKCN